ncbi:MAG: hypothetical protein KF708_13190 [Pirellulales bacterium]|nr:hypothetical protein [Pirellulales bacterium]
MQRDDRRRRVLTEEVIGPAKERESETATAGGAVLRKARRKANYGDAKFMDGQPRITDLIPTRIGFLLLWFLLGVAILAGLEALYAWMPELAAHTTDGRVAAFDLDSEGSLGAVFSSATLALAGLVTLIVYSVRRHKQDDYAGRYRIWLWASLCWFIMAIDESASLHEGFKELMTMLTGTRLVGDGSLWWVAAYTLVLGVVGMRLVLDMRVCWSSTTMFIIAGLCYAASVVVQMQGILPETGAVGVMVEEGLEMAGNLFLLLSMTLHARYVILESQGLLPQRKRKAKGESAEKEAEPRRVRRKREEEGTDKPAATGNSRTETPATVSRGSLLSGSRTQLRTDAQGSSSQPHSRLSKAERKAARRQQRHEQDERELRTR